MLYSKTKRAFYSSEINGENIPPDVVELDDSKYRSLLDGQSLGKVIAPDHDGNPILVEPTPDHSGQITSVTMRQARLALLAAGKLDAIGPAIDALPEPQRSGARIEWEFAGRVEKSSPLIHALAPVIGVDDAGLDKLFSAAATL